MSVATFIWASAIVVLIFAVIGYNMKGKSQIRRLWDNFYNFLNWLPYIFIFISAIAIIFFKSELVFFIFTNDYTLLATVIILIVIGFPLYSLISIGLFLGDLLEMMTKKKKKKK